MIDPLSRMAHNRWQNQPVRRADGWTSRRERGAFFGSIHKTLSIWGDDLDEPLHRARPGIDATDWDAERERGVRRDDRWATSTGRAITWYSGGQARITAEMVW